MRIRNACTHIYKKNENLKKMRYLPTYDWRRKRWKYDWWMNIDGSIMNSRTHIIKKLKLTNIIWIKVSLRIVIDRDNHDDGCTTDRTFCSCRHGRGYLIPNGVGIWYKNMHVRTAPVRVWLATQSYILHKPAHRPPQAPKRMLAASRLPTATPRINSVCIVA